MRDLLADKEFTSLEEAKDYLLNQRKEFNLVLENIQAGVVVINQEENYTYFNSIACKQLGIEDSDSMIGKKLKDCHSPASYKQAKDIIKSFKQGLEDSFVQEITLFGKTYMDYTSAIRDNKGEYLGTVRLSIDISKRKEFEEKLYDAEVKYRLFKEINDLHKDFTEIENGTQYKDFIKNILNILLVLSGSKQGAILLKNYFEAEDYVLQTINLEVVKENYEDVIAIFKEAIKSQDYTGDIKNNLKDKEMFKEEFGIENVNRLFSYPIVIDTETVGWVVMLNKDEDYTKVDTEIIKIIIRHLKTGIHKVKYLLKQLKEERMKKSIDIAAEIQTSFLPDRCPEYDELEIATYFQPARKVGGDYFGFDQRDKELGLLIADVMGKGIPAAIMVATIHSAFHTLMRFNQSPAEILDNLNNNLYDDLKDSPIFVSAFYGFFDFKNNTFKYSNAAHCPPLLWSAKQEKVISLSESGILCGIKPDYIYQCNQTCLSKGDILLFYTDGVIDIKNFKNKRFKISKIKKIVEENHYLSAQKLKEKLVDSLDSFSHKQTQIDDISFVVCKFYGC